MNRVPPSRRRRQRRRRIAIGALVVFVLGVVVGALAVRDLVAIRDDLEAARASVSSAARADVEAFRDDERRGQLTRRMQRALADLRGARQRLDRSIPLRATSLFPGARYQKDGLRRLIIDAEAATTAAVTLSDAAGGFLATSGRLAGRVPIEGLATVQDALNTTAAELRRVTRGRRGLWGPLGDARTDFDALASEASTRVQLAADVVGVARGIAGDGRPRRCVVAGLNNAEMRDQGMVLSVASITFDRGAFDVERTDPVSDLDVPTPTTTPIPPGTAEMFGGLDLNRAWQSANASADTALAGRLLVDLYVQSTGLQADCVVAVDVPALAALVEVLGSIRVAGGPLLDHQRVGPYLLSEQYAGLAPGSGQQQRREQVADIATTVVQRLRTNDVDLIALGRRLGRAAAGRHVWMWSGVADEQAVFERSGLSGGLLAGPVETLDQRARSTFHVAVEDATGTKTDFFVRTAIDVDVTVSRAGTAIVRTTVTVRNEAPVGARPSYALGPNTAATDRPGTYVARVYLWAPTASTAFDAVTESGLLVAQKPLAVEPGQTAQVSFETLLPGRISGPGGELRLRWVPQPRALPSPLSVQLSAREWDIEGEEMLTLDTSGTVLAVWRLSRR